LQGTFRLSNDKRFVEKVEDVVFGTKVTRVTAARLNVDFPPPLQNCH